MSAYQDALALLPDPDRNGVEGSIITMALLGDGWLRVARNVNSETALTPEDFATLLRAFVTEVRGGVSEADAWVQACRSHGQWKGRQAGPSHRPASVGFARVLTDHAAVIAETSHTTLSRQQIEQLLQRVVVPSVRLSPYEERVLRGGLLGRFVIWVTFDETLVGDPFDWWDGTTVDLRENLGLGGTDAGETLILLCYPAPPTLHRPSIGEAAEFPWYRPHPDPDSPWGRTEPLPPNVNNRPGRPELVHRTHLASDVVFPLRASQP